MAWLSLLLARGASAGAVQEIIDITGYRPSPVPGEFIAKVVPIRWDSRCMPVVLQVNDTLDPLPNPLGPPIVSLATATRTLQTAADLWNSVPTSFAKVKVAGKVSNPGDPGLDLINEVTFRTPAGFAPNNQQTIFSIDAGPIVGLRTTRLIADFAFTDGLDIDGDGVPDVSAALSTCQIVNGHTKFPAGIYKAGTIIDIDLIFNTGASSAADAPPGFRFTTGPAAGGSDPRSVDLFSVAVQAIGDFLGVGHSRTNQRSARDGLGATMFPYLDTGDPSDTLPLRHLDSDAVASLSTLYPKNSFKESFGFITGEIRLGSRNEPLLGGSVFAIDQRTGAIVGTAISGTSQLSVSQNGLSGTFLDAAFHAIDGKYTLAVPPGTYAVGVAPLRDERSPVSYFNINLQSQLTHFLQQNDFEETLYTGRARRGEEEQPRRPAVVEVRAGETIRGIDIVTERTVKIANYGSFDRRGFASARPGSYYAVRIPKEQLMAAESAAGGDATIEGGAFFTAVEDSSVVPVFAEALLTTGTLRRDGTAVLDLDHPLARQRDFAGRDSDYAPFHLRQAQEVTERVRQGLRRGAIGDLFLVLRLPAGPYPGISHAAPEIGLDGGVANNDVPVHGLSYSSADGRVFTQDKSFNYMFKLILLQGSD